MEPRLTKWSMRTVPRAVKWPLLDLIMQREVMRGMAIAPGPTVGPVVDPASGPGTVMVRGPDMTGHGTGPDMMPDLVVMTDPVVIPPVPRPGPDMMTDPVVIPPVPGQVQT
ncbi:zinc finger protein 358-like [Perca fluviatilis]|uniref:zinc finger protein 358-like n=1 Tax=Perca fluviatilis TaxID=8168 RepID=UPI001965762D|nr:zinc finger protein 358-like [Perca fluviatilis]